MVRTTVIAVHMTKNRHHSSPVQQLVKTITLTQVSDANMTESCHPSWSVNRILVSLRPGFDEICRPRHPGSGSEYTNWKTESGVSQQEGANLIMTRCSSDHRLLALGPAMRQAASMLGRTSLGLVCLFNPLAFTTDARRST